MLITEEYCTYCGAALEHVCPFGRLASHQDGKVIGQIYQCPNQEGFAEEEERNEYIKETGEEPDDDEETVCSSANFNGYFYTSLGSSHLHEGYPC